MNKKILINIINKDKFEENFLSDMRKMVHTWSKLSDDLIFMPISEKTEIKIREILINIGDEMTQICDLMIKENNKAS